MQHLEHGLGNSKDSMFWWFLLRNPVPWVVVMAPQTVLGAQGWELEIRFPRAYIKSQAGLVAPWTPNTWEVRTGSLSQASYLGWQKSTSPGFSKRAWSSKCVEWEQSRKMPIADFRLEHMCTQMNLYNMNMHAHMSTHTCAQKKIIKNFTQEPRSMILIDA